MASPTGASKAGKCSMSLEKLVQKFQNIRDMVLFTISITIIFPRLFLNPKLAQDIEKTAKAMEDSASALGKYHQLPERPAID